MRLAGTDRKPIPGARSSGPIPPDERVELALLLRRRASAPPYPDVVALSRTPLPARAYLSREEFGRRHGANPEDVERVREFARTHGLEVGGVSVGARIVQLAGPADRVSRIFGVTLERWRYPGGSYRGHPEPASLPRELEEVAVGVFGLDDRPQAKAHFVRHRASAPTDVGYSPSTVAEAYNFPAGTDGTGQTIGILELGGGFSASDLQSFFGGLGASVPSVTVVSVDGAQNAPTGDPNGPDAEVELDIEVAGACAPGARIVVYFAPNTDRGFLDGLSQAVHDTTNRPTILSVSWGSPESAWSASAESAINGAIEDAATMGVTVLVAAGDGGASDGVSSGALTVDFPASSPFATGCGGTKLELSGGTIASEVVWNDLSMGEGATGGGVSETFPLPSYQAAAGVPGAPNGFVGRGVPDVAGDADPTTGYSVFVDGAGAVLGGTSAVAPLWSALVARLNEALGTPVGFLNPRLYSAPADTTFHDVTSGNNDGYSAGPGWDPCTGWGTPDGTLLLQSLRSPSGPP